ncbi:MAG TPA: hypothetical protein PLJ03_01595, partial [Syntrophales bacterium]|nr:hypothetical protein [Syntrophales bacterium]
RSTSRETLTGSRKRSRPASSGNRRSNRHEQMGSFFDDQNGTNYQYLSRVTSTFLQYAVYQKLR